MILFHILFKSGSKNTFARKVSQKLAVKVNRGKKKSATTVWQLQGGRQMNKQQKQITKIVKFLLVHAQLYLILCDPWTVIHQTPLSMEFPRQEYWSGLPFHSPRDLTSPGIKPMSHALAGRFFTTVLPRKILAMAIISKSNSHRLLNRC